MIVICLCGRFSGVLLEGGFGEGGRSLSRRMLCSHAEAWRRRWEGVRACGTRSEGGHDVNRPDTPPATRTSSRLRTLSDLLVGRLRRRC